MQKRNTQKQCNRQVIFSSAVLPVLCGKCGQPTVRKHDSRWKHPVKHYCSNPECSSVYCIPDEELWNMVGKAMPEAARKIYTASDDTVLDIRRLTNEIEHDLQSIDFDADALQAKIFGCAALQYKAKRIAPKESMDFSNVKPCSPAFIRKLKQLATAVMLIDEKNIRLIPTDERTAGKENHDDTDYDCTD